MPNVNDMTKRSTVVALVVASVTLLGLVPAAQAEVRVTPNYKLNTDPSPFRGRDGVGLAASPANPQNVVALHANYLDSTCDISRSTDGGATWTPSLPLTPPGPGAGQQPFVKSCTTGAGSSQYVEWGTGQNVYTVITAQRSVVGDAFLADPTVLLYKSTNGGMTWTGVVAMEGGPGSDNFTSQPQYSRPSLAVHRGAGAGGSDRIYVAALEARGDLCPGSATLRCRPIKATVSNDGGQTFGPAVDVTPDATNATDFPSRPAVNKDGSVTVAWRTAGTPAGLIQVARSTDAGQTWGAPIDVTQVLNMGTAVTTHVYTPPSPSGSGSYPRMVSDPNAGANGRIYMVYMQGPDAPSGNYQGTDHWMANALQVYFQRSNDGGLTWSQPKRISEQTSLPGSRIHQTRHAGISLSPSGRINITWQDRRHWYQGPGERHCSHSHIFCEDIRLGDTYYSTSTDGGTSFSTPLRISDRSHNNDVGYDTRPSGYWWYGPQAIGVGGDQVLVGWMDSREGNWDTDNEDIYLAKVNFNASGAPASSHVDPPSNAVARSVALSKIAYQGGTEGALIGGNRDPACTVPPCSTGPATRNASSVVIANEGDVAGALAGTVLARANPGPVLLSPAAGLPASVKAEVSRMSPAGAYVIGDTAKLSAAVVTDLASAGVPADKITRLEGSDAQTAADIARAMDARSAAEKTADVPAFDAVVITNPASPAHAAAAAGLAAARRLPVLYVGDTTPAATTAALSDLDITAATPKIVVGGTSVVNGTVFSGLGANTTRRGGANPYETSQAVVAESKERGLPSNVVYVADGAKPMDAVLLGGVVARATGMLVLAPAPLYNTASGQAASFGLSGIQKFSLLGPPKPGASQKPPSPTYPQPGTVVDPFAGCPSSTTNVIRGTAGRNTLTGTSAGDRIFALAGNDRVNALAGNDCVDLGAGSDNGQGGRGNDLIVGGRGKDRIGGSAGKDRLSGGADADKLSGGSGNDRLTGGSGKDTISAGSGKDKVLARDRKRDKINCGGGRDSVTADRIDRVARNCERVKRR